jgi:acyl-CoA thioester hydrolase
MAEFNFYHPIEVRYGDLDPQGHVNNARFFTYLEQARISYVIHLGLWDGRSFFDVGFILADAHLTFHAPVLFGQPVRVGVRVARLGNKSLSMEYRMEETEARQVFASGSTVLVTYNYHDGRTIPIPAHWRDAIAAFEGLTETDQS